MADHLQTDFFPLGSGTLVSCGWSGPTCRCPWRLWAWSRPRVLFLPQSCSTKAGSTVCLPGICSVAVPRIRISPRTGYGLQRYGDLHQQAAKCKREISWSWLQPELQVSLLPHVHLDPSSSHRRPISLGFHFSLNKEGIVLFRPYGSRSHRCSSQGT